MVFQQNVLLCYRGRYRAQVETLAAKLRTRGLSVTYDREILVSPGSPDAPEVEWISLSTEGAGESTTWRASLKDAIGHSEVVVFLVDPHDQSVNIINEISWVAKAGRHAFYVLDTRAEKVSLETEAIYVSSLNITCAMALRRWEVPGFDYLLVAHEDPNELDARLDVAVNRIEEYLERVRVHPVPQVRLDTDITLADIERVPVIRARKRLTEIQEKVHQRFRLPAPRHTGDPYQEALEYAFRYEKGAVVEGEFIRPPGSPFRFPLVSERRRFLRTQRIIQRVRPDRYEKYPIFSLLARQAASVELLLEQAAGEGKRFEPVVTLGTLPFTAVDDVTSVLVDRDYAIIFLDGAFIDFVYQVAKVSVCAWKLLTPPDRLPVRFSSQPADVADVVEANPGLEDGLFQSVQAYATRGLPGASIEGAPKPAYQTPLSVLVDTAERFMIGRGYAQLHLMDPTFPAPVPLRSAGAESEAQRTLTTDGLSTAYVLESAAMLDRVDPAIALQGCGMPVVCVDLIHRAVGILDPATRASATQTGPSPNERLEMVKSAYLAAAMRRGLDERRATESLTPALEAWQTPRLLWSRVERRIQEEREKGARPAWIWR